MKIYYCSLICKFTNIYNVVNKCIYLFIQRTKNPLKLIQVYHGEWCNSTKRKLVSVIL